MERLVGPWNGEESHKRVQTPHLPEVRILEGSEKVPVLKEGCSSWMNQKAGPQWLLMGLDIAPRMQRVFMGSTQLFPLFHSPQAGLSDSQATPVWYSPWWGRWGVPRLMGRCDCLKGVLAPPCFLPSPLDRRQPVNRWWSGLVGVLGPYPILHWLGSSPPPSPLCMRSYIALPVLLSGLVNKGVGSKTLSSFFWKCRHIL